MRDYPNECPICHKICIPTLIIDRCEIAISPLSRGLAYQWIFRCPNDKCQSYFIAFTNSPEGGGLITTAPRSPKKESFPKEIEDVSPNFVEIHNQAQEASGLTQIYGMALRKSLEFLIKDFCTFLRPEDKTSIENAPLGTCIENYVPAGNLKEVSKRAIWLGNDETHYIRKWEDHDITDLKRLIHLTVYWISQEVSTRKYQVSMPTKK